MTDPAKRGEIHLGDLVRTLKTLDWESDEQARAVAACLGFGLRAASKPRPPTEIYDRQRYRTPAPTPAVTPVPRPVLVPPAPEIPPALPANPLASRLEPLTERLPPAPDNADWLDDEDALLDDESETEVAREPLFPERTNRHILSASLATLRTGAEIDVPGLIAAICRREVASDLPRRRESTLEPGCQLLLDYSGTMVPFWEDLNDLVGQVADVVGAAGTRVYSFDSRPTEAVRWTAHGGRDPWGPDGRPVLAATDFGIQGGAGRAAPDPAWRVLTERCGRDGIPLIILVPWPEERWPRDIGGNPELVHWSPHTSAAMIQRKIGLGHRLG